jgi:uncharacterized small protein (DUF1192 family)
VGKARLRRAHHHRREGRRLGKSVGRQREFIMSNQSSLSLSELNDRIAILQDNIRQLVEQAAAASGEQSEERIADRIAQQNEELEKLTKERDARSKS